MISILRAAVTAAAALGLTAAPADAAGLVYSDKGNVWVATPDLSVNRALTTDGTETTPAYDQAPKGELVGPYHFPSAADDGRVISARYRYAEDGGANFFWKFIDAQGAHVASNIVTMTNSCGTAPRPLGPFDARISAAGDFVAFSFYCSGRSVGLNTTTGYVQNPPAWSGERVSWFGRRLMASASGASSVQNDTAAAPLEDGWSPFVAGDAGESIGRVEIARAGGKMMIESTVGDEQRLVFGTYAGSVPDVSESAVRCRLGTAAAARDVVGDAVSFHASWSPDGTLIAWQDAEGVKVAPAPDLTNPQNAEGQTCTLSAAPRLVSATGVHPSFTAHTWTHPTSGGGGTTPPAGGGTAPGPGGGTTIAPPTGKVTGRLPASVKATALTKGVTLKLTVPGAGRLSATAKLGRRTVATGKATAKTAGRVNVKLRLSAKERRRAKRLRRKKLTLLVVFTSAGGQKSTLKRTVRVR